MSVSCLITHPKAVTIELKLSRDKDNSIKIIEHYSKDGLMDIYRFVAKQLSNPESEFNQLTEDYNVIRMTIKPVNENPINSLFIVSCEDYAKKMLKKIKELVVKQVTHAITTFDRNVSHEYAEAHIYKTKVNTEKLYKDLIDQLGIVTLDELKCLTHNRLQQFGFGLWSDHDPIRLIPLRLIPLLDPNMEVVSIDGNRCLLKDADTDIWFGCIAYGFYLDR